MAKEAKKFSKQPKAVNRRLKSLTRLEVQLKSKVKPLKNGSTDLSEIDVKRINNEIEVLKSRI